MRIPSRFVTSGLALALAVAFLLPLPAAAEPAPAELVAAEYGATSLLQPLELRMVDLVNADRAAHGLGPVTFDPLLIEIARERAGAQLTPAPLTHYDATGQLAFVRLLARAGLGYALAGENLARASGSSEDVTLATRIEHALMLSPTHRQNILEPAFDRLAVGVVQEPGTGRVAFAQIFRAGE